jgi:hypothetical protein
MTRELKRRSSLIARPRNPNGPSFEVQDLILARNWAAFHALEMLIRLDHGIEGEEYEEIIEFHAGLGYLSCLIMWRNARGVFVQPIPGRKQMFASVAEALEGLRPNTRVEVTDIKAAAWPIDRTLRRGSKHLLILNSVCTPLNKI